jgi:hypothetical protein
LRYNNKPYTERKQKAILMGQVPGGKSMKEIKVLYFDESIGYVIDSKLDVLISTGKVKAFLRASGWVNVGVDPIREIRYRGSERRRAIMA